MDLQVATWVNIITLSIKFGLRQSLVNQTNIPLQSNLIKYTTNHKR